MRTENCFLNIWKKLEKTKKQPLFARKLIIKDYEKFSRQVFNGSLQTKKKIARSLYDGDIY